MNAYEEIILSIRTYFSCIENKNHMIHGNNIVKYYVKNEETIKRNVLTDYNAYHEPLKFLLTKFVKNVSKLNCHKIKSVLAMIYLIFDGNIKHITAGFLFFLLLCSYKELAFTLFSLSFIKTMKNENTLGSKLIDLGGTEISEFMDNIKSVCPQFSGVKYPILSENQKIKHPINIDLILVEDFGLRFCLSILEIIANGLEINDSKLLLLFFGSRMDMAAEVLLSIDILKEAIRFGIFIIETVSLLLHDNNVFHSIKAKIMFLYGLDISNFKKKFDECIRFKENYAILNGIVNYTDYQKKAKQRSKSTSERSKIALRSKYPFL